jgi:hypothetical protein
VQDGKLTGVFYFLLTCAAMGHGNDGNLVLMQIMVPLPIAGSYSLYVYDRYMKRINVLDPVFTLRTENEYAIKHEENAKTLLRALKLIGESLDDGWDMKCCEWRIRYNTDMHLPCSP